MTITLTAGHSNQDPGVCATGYTEAGLMAELVRKCVAELSTRGLTVKSDVVGAVNLPLPEAIKLIAGSRVAVECHMNGAANPQANGTEVIALPKDKLRAQAVAQAVAAALGTKLRGNNGHTVQEQSQHGKLGYVQAGGMILEVCFLSSAADRDKYLLNKELVVKALCNVLEQLSK